MDDLSQCNVMVVDDNETNIDILVDILGDDYQVSVATSGESALEDMENHLPDLVLLDVMMPGMDGYEVCRQIKANKKSRGIPVIFVTAMNDTEEEIRGFELGAVDYITKPISPPRVKTRIANHLRLKRAKDLLMRQKETLEKRVIERTRELTLTQEQTIFSLTNLAETRDPETGGHIRRTQNYVRLLATRLKHHERFRHQLNDAAIELLYKCAPLHDIGKVGVHDSILLKPGRLTEEEFEEMKRHTVYGRDALVNANHIPGGNSFLTLAREIAYSHHEKWDGTGYPEGLQGEDIPLSGRLMTLADVYDALISKRIYKAPFPHHKAVKIIAEGRGKHFDPDITDAFLELEEQFRQTALSYADFDEEREALDSSCP
ncbi:MAG: two-component system response regulator [Desulfobacteraceae bacterium]|nr:two-component system response regulator [Desulfobacteraceae bacterium]